MAGGITKQQTCACTNCVLWHVDAQEWDCQRRSLAMFLLTSPEESIRPGDAENVLAALDVDNVYEHLLQRAIRTRLMRAWRSCRATGGESLASENEAVDGKGKILLEIIDERKKDQIDSLDCNVVVVVVGTMWKSTCS